MHILKNENYIPAVELNIEKARMSPSFIARNNHFMVDRRKDLDMRAYKIQIMQKPTIRFSQEKPWS